VTQTASMILAFVLAGLDARENHYSLGTDSHRVPGRHRERVRRSDPQAFFVQMVGKEDLPNAIALNSSIFHGARVCGAGDRGHDHCVADAHHVKSSEGWCFLMNGLSFLAVIGALAADADPEDGTEATRGFPISEFHQGFRFAMHDLPIPFHPASSERAELVRLAVRGLPATICQGTFCIAGRGGLDC